jgi:hypothetical protein
MCYVWSPAVAGKWRARRLRVERHQIGTHGIASIVSNLPEFAIDRWRLGYVIRRSEGITPYRPSVPAYEPLDKVATAAFLYR